MTVWIARYGQVLVALLIAFVGIAVGAFAGRYARRGMQKKFSPQAAILTSKALKYGIIAFTLLMTLNHLGIRLPALLGAAGIAGVAIGFAAQTSLSNLISGIFLVLERPYAVGDIIRVGSDTGIVHGIDLLSLKLRTFDNLLIRIPNETVIKSSVTNITAFNIRRIDIELGVAYKEDIEHVLRVLARVVDANPLCLDEPEPLIMFKGFGDSALEIQLGVWSVKTDFRAVRNSVMIDVKKAFDAEGIEIPFPHRTLYVGADTDPFPVRVVASAAAADPSGAG